MLFLKVLTACVVVVIVWHIVELARIGKQLALARDTYLLSVHRSKVACVGCLTVLAVVLIEGMVRMSSQPYATSGILLAFHLVVVAMLVTVFFAIVFRFTGLYNTIWHRRYAYSFFALYAAAAITGGVLLYHLPA